MPFTWRHDRERELVVARSEGRISPVELGEYYADAFGTPESACYDELGLGQHSPTVEVRGPQWQRIMAMRRRHSSGRRVKSAIVLPADAAFGGGRVGQAMMSFGDTVDFTAVRTLPEALAVLGLPEDYELGV